MKFFITLWLACFFHGGDVATFTITTSNDTAHVLVKLEAEDIAKALNTTVNTISQDALQDYLNAHVSYVVNGQLVSSTIQDLSLEHHHLLIKTTLNGTFSTIHSLQIENTMLFEVKAHQTNVIKLRFNDMFRDFLTNQKRPLLNIEL